MNKKKCMCKFNLNPMHFFKIPSYKMNGLIVLYVIYWSLLHQMASNVETIAFFLFKRKYDLVAEQIVLAFIRGGTSKALAL